MDRVLLRKPSPHVLPTESLAEFDDDRRGIREALKPPNRIAAIYADEFAEQNWQAKRYRHAMSRRPKKYLPEALYEMLCELDERDRGELAELVERWSRGDPNAESEVSAVLKSHGLEKADLESEALVRSLPELARIDQLHTSACSLRDKALAGAIFAGEISMPTAQAPVGHAAERGVVRLDRPKKKAG